MTRDELKSIEDLYKKTFNTNSKVKITSLSGGLKNKVFKITDKDKKIVLKVSPIDESKMIKTDRNLIYWESEMLRLMKDIDIPSPKLLYCDKSKNPKYLFMSHIEGVNYEECKTFLKKEDKEKIEYELGKITKKISEVKSNKFFLPSKKDKEFKDNYNFIKYLFENLLIDVDEKNIDLESTNSKEIIDILKEKKKSLNNIKEITLAHTDLWDGNIMIDNDEISGIVDFSDLYYCDPLMNFYFHTIDDKEHKSFLKGYNKEILTHDEKVRVEIYKMYVILKMIVDCKLKDYGRFDYMYNFLEKKIKILKKI